MWRADSALVLAFAFALDGTLCEPPNALHPVVWMGHAIAPLKRMRVRTPTVELVLGGLYVVAVTVGSLALGWAILRVSQVHHLVHLAAQVFLLWSCFALKGLWAAGREMALALEHADLPRARRALLSLCSRDPSELSPSELAGATIESLTENASDSVVAPLFYFALFGVPGALFYRAANTLDAMVGYRGRYEYLGKVAARLDDVLNFVPARLTASALALAGLVLRMPVGRGVSVCLRDGSETESPNAGRPMAMAAGLLGVRLDKRDAYVLGRELATPDVVALRRALSLTAWAGVLSVLVLLAVLWMLGVHHD
ncbi:MAG: Adenosylcobinamide-phosphate synthase [Pseudomonadota bacterium]|jgi:adenosylcobinamide-phosphate synthase